MHEFRYLHRGYTGVHGVTRWVHLDTRGWSSRGACSQGYTCSWPRSQAGNHPLPGSPGPGSTPRHWLSSLGPDSSSLENHQQSCKTLCGINASVLCRQAGQQIRSKIDSFQNANFLISQLNPMMLPFIGIVSERRFQWGSHHRVWLRNEKVSIKTVLFTLS